MADNSLRNSIIRNRQKFFRPSQKKKVEPDKEKEPKESKEITSKKEPVIIEKNGNRNQQVIHEKDSKVVEAKKINRETSHKNEVIKESQSEDSKVTHSKNAPKNENTAKTIPLPETSQKKKIPRKFNIKFNYQEFLFGENKENHTPEEIQEQISKEQISFDIKVPTKEPYYNFKRKLTRLESLLEIMPYWKNLVNVFTLIFGLFIPIFMSYLIFNNYDYLKEKMPLFYNNALKQWESDTDKGIFILMPLIVAGFNLLIVRLCMMMYNFDRKLVYVISSALIMVNVLVLISFIQILYLVI